MIGILYNAFYIEKYFPWAVQKYKDKDGEPISFYYRLGTQKLLRLGKVKLNYELEKFS